MPTRVHRGRTLALVGAGLLAMSAMGAVPALAQLKAPDATVQTPYGPAPISFADIVASVKPSVVSIQTRTGGGNEDTARGGPNNRRGGGGGGEGGGGGGGIPGLPDDHPLNEFFKNLPREFGGPGGGGGGGRGGGGGGARPAQSQGSGFIISEDGLVVTNNHVIDGANRITVVMDNGDKIEATLVGTDPRTDIALLKLKTDRKFQPLRFSKEEGRVGDWVLAVGNPFGLGGTVTAGIISALARDINSGPYDYIQIDAAVNRGNSGGPTFNLKGEVIGVNTAIYSQSGGNIGIAFAVPAKTASNVIDQLKSNGSVSRGWLGVKIQSVDEDTAASLGLSEAKGALVNEVTANGPAAAAGLRTGDTILTVDGQRINDSRDLARRIAEFSPNTTVDVRVLRAGKEQSIPVKLGLFPRSSEEIARLEQPPGTKPKPSTPVTVEMGALGLTLSTPGDRKTEGVEITDVRDGSDAAVKGLRSGDTILEINGTKVTTPADIEAAVKAAQDSKRPAVLLNVKSGANTRIVAVRLTGKG